MIVGSYVPEGVARRRLGDARRRAASPPSTTSTRRSRSRSCERGDCEYLSPRADPALRSVSLVHRRPDARAPRARLRLAARARAVLLGRPGRCITPSASSRALGPRLLGTYSDDRQPALDALLLEPARRGPQARFVVAGPQYPAHDRWPANVERIDAPAAARASRLLQRAALHAERHARRHGRAPATRRACGCSRPPRAARRSSATAGPASTRCSSRAAKSS